MCRPSRISRGPWPALFILKYCRSLICIQAQNCSIVRITASSAVCFGMLPPNNTHFLTPPLPQSRGYVLIGIGAHQLAVLYAEAFAKPSAEAGAHGSPVPKRI